MTYRAPRLLGATVAHGAGDQIAVTARVLYGTKSHETLFVGSRWGNPGPVVMVLDGMETFVADPGRFGDRFGAEWVARFYATMQDRGL